MATLTESIVEDHAAVYYGAVGVAIKRGEEIDDAGERGGPGQCILQSRLAAVLHRLNPDLPHDTIEGVVRTLAGPPHPTLIQNNRWFHTLLTDGVEVEYRDAKSGETRGGRARLVDFDNPGANDLLVVRQLTVTGPSGKLVRPDLTVFLNGLPIAAYQQVADSLFDLLTACVVENEKMAEMRDYLLPKLLSGAVRVSDSECIATREPEPA